MPVNTPHHSYQEHAARWTRCRDAHEGGDAVKSKSTLYLPLLEGHVSSAHADYIGYKTRALFYPATGRTVQGLAGLVFAKPPTVAGVPKLHQPALEDVTLTGTSLGAFGLTLCKEVLVTGRVGTLIDMPESPSTGASPSRPYWVMYQAEHIVNWQVTRINGKQTLTMVVLMEQKETTTQDQFTPDVEWQYRVLQLIDNRYVVTIYTEGKDDKKGQYFAGEPRIPLRKGEPLTFIPFTFLNAENVGVEVVEPPLLALVDVNLSHYRTSADHEHGAHFTALPTPYITGAKKDTVGELRIGSGNAWILPNPSSTAGMLEFTGAGLKSLADLKEEKRQLMATVGARMLETQKNTQEAAQTVRLRHAGESSSMSVIAEALGHSLTQSTRQHLWWAGIEEATAQQAQLSMNPDVMDELSPDDIRVLMETWQKGAVSKRTVYYNLSWGEWTRPGVTFEEEEAEIALEDRKEPPTLPTTES